jgi:DNA modification methylase
VTVLHGDCLAVLPTLDAASVDAIVCDPPYGLSFMGKNWDHGIPGVAFWAAALRVAKPGAHLVAFGGTRTFHRLACAIEDAGWEIRDTLMWVYGSGFPKSLDVSKAMDKAAGAEREVIGVNGNVQRAARIVERTGGGEIGFGAGSLDARLTAPATDAAKQWAGWGTALKPAAEIWWLARKPLAGTVAQTVARYGTGGLNIEKCRVSGDGLHPVTQGLSTRIYGGGAGLRNEPGAYEVPSGRWPANVVLSHSDCNGTCAPDCAVRLLDEQSGERRSPQHYERGTNARGPLFGIEGGKAPGYGDTGGASRFMYCAKASKAERWEYLSCDCEAPIFPAWVNAVQSRNGQTASTSRGRATSGATLTDGSASPMSPSGSASTGASPLGSKSITSTETSRTTDWTTSASSVPPSTSASIPDASCAATAGGSRAASAASSSPSDPTTGTSPQTATRSMGVAVPATSLRSSEPSNCGNCGKPLQRAGHPTVKPLALMRWLCRLVTPPGGTILDPFCGSGSTGCAAVLEGFRFLGIEREAEYVAIAERRIAHWQRVGQRYARLLAYRAAHPPEPRAPVEDPDQITLFGPAA